MVDVSWHYGGDYPKDLPKENAATHIGMFIAWCINNDLISNELKKDFKEDVNDVKSHKMKGSEFLIKVCDEKFIDQDLSEFGQEFTNDYYENKSKFARKFGDYNRGFLRCFLQKSREKWFE